MPPSICSSPVFSYLFLAFSTAKITVSQPADFVLHVSTDGVNYVDYPNASFVTFNVFGPVKYWAYVSAVGFEDSPIITQKYTTSGLDNSPDPIQLGVPTSSPLSGFISAVPFEVAFFASDPDVNLQISVNGGGYVTLDELAPVYFVTQSVSLSVRAVSQYPDGRLPSSPLVCSYVISSGAGGGAGSGPDIRNLGYSVANGFLSYLPNNAIQVEISDDFSVLTYAQLKARINQIIYKLDAIYSASSPLNPQCKVFRMNYPAYAAPAPTVKDKTEVMTVRCYVEFKNTITVGVSPVQISVTFKGVPAIKTRVDLEPLIEALFTSSLGFCSDGVTPRFSRVKYISCISSKEQ